MDDESSLKDDCKFAADQLRLLADLAEVTPNWVYATQQALRGLADEIEKMYEVFE